MFEDLIDFEDIVKESGNVDSFVSVLAREIWRQMNYEAVRAKVEAELSQTHYKTGDTIHLRYETTVEVK
jgi:hypothetical protein